MKIKPVSVSIRIARDGFTLVETLVAISILLLVIIGPMTIASRGMQSAFYADEQTTAVYLAQEAIESVQRLRDNNALEVYEPGGSSSDTWEWLSSLPLACTGNNGCDLDLSEGGYRTCSGSNCVLKKYVGADSQDFVYGYGNGPDWEVTPYTRIIKIEPDVTPGLNAVKVTVTISWTARLFSGATREVVLQSWLYDHYVRYE